MSCVDKFPWQWDNPDHILASLFLIKALFTQLTTSEKSSTHFECREYNLFPHRNNSTKENLIQGDCCGVIEATTLGITPSLLVPDKTWQVKQERQLKTATS